MITVRKASTEDAKAVHRMLSAIPWIANSVKTDSGLSKTRSRCDSGEVWVVDANGKVVSIMFLRPDSLAESLGRRSLSIPILTTLKEHRRRGYARLLVRRAKEEASNIGSTIEGYPKNDMSRALLRSEGFELIEGCEDNHNNDLYRWTR
jgi:GNAT superfamily N-acetyltransferase